MRSPKDGLSCSFVAKRLSTFMQLKLIIFRKQCQLATINFCRCLVETVSIIDMMTVLWFCWEPYNGTKHMSARNEYFTPGDSQGANTTQCSGLIRAEKTRNVTKKAVSVKRNTEQLVTSLFEFRPLIKLREWNPTQPYQNTSPQTWYPQVTMLRLMHIAEPRKRMRFNFHTDSEPFLFVCVRGASSPSCPVYFIFMQFSVKGLPHNRYEILSSRLGTPWEILDPPVTFRLRISFLM